MSTDASPVRVARVAAGLSQAAVAAAAGISRQGLGAIEAGRHRPSVDAALAIARVVGSSVEELFGAASAMSEPVVGQRARDGGPVLAARVGDRVVHASSSAALAFQGWPPANATLAGGAPRLLPGADLDALVVVGCDPALGSAAAMLPPGGPRRVIALSGSTSAALEAMRQGSAHGALVHDRAERMPLPGQGGLRFHLARWRVGVASRGRRARSVSELCERGTRVVQREAGASSQKAFLSAVSAAGAHDVSGPVASSHIEVARRVVDGGAPAGVTMEPAALQFGLQFGELEEHVAELWIDGRWRGHPGVEALGNVLCSAAFTTRMDLIGGYELAHCGDRTGEQE